MGGKRMFTAMQALEYADVTLPWKNGERKAKKKVDESFVEEELHHLGSTELLTLLAIAYRQRDEGDGYDDKDCICYASPEALADLAHMGPSSIKKAREFLCDSGLVTFTKKGVFKNIKNSSKTNTYTNVYQIDMEKLAMVRNSAPRRKLHQVGKSDDVYDDKSHDATEESHDAAEKSHDATTNITANKKKNITIDDSSISIIRGYIAEKLGIDVGKIGPKGIKAGIKGLSAQTVKNVIDTFAENNQEELGDEELIGRLINNLKKQPTSSSPETMTNEEIETFFSKPEKVKTFKEKLNDCWKKICEKLDLKEDKLDLKEDMNRVYSQFTGKFKYHLPDENKINDIINDIIERCKGLSGHDRACELSAEIEKYQ